MTPEMIRDFIDRCESEYENKLDKAAKYIAESRTISFVLISGASCAGKTTTTKKLKHDFEKRGIPTEFISLDDFYKPVDEVPLDEEGKPDFETINSLDLDYLHVCMKALADGKEALLPRFDFQKQKRDQDFYPLKLNEGNIVIIEGLHAMNPEIYKNYISDEKIFKLYLYAKGDYQIRLLRRIVRDVNFRATSAETTFSMWDSVRSGEHKYIVPFKETADLQVNTYFEYETNVFKEEGISALGDIREESTHYRQAKELLDMLAPLEPIDRKYVPDNSLMWEFIKK